MKLRDGGIALGAIVVMMIWGATVIGAKIEKSQERAQAKKIEQAANAQK